MRKQILFQQVSPSASCITIKNIFGFSINYVEDQIKRHSGKWDPIHRKFKVPINTIPALTKQLQAIDRSYYIEQVPSIVQELIDKCAVLGGARNKVKKQILIDQSMTNRYQYIDQNVVTSILETRKGTYSGNKCYDKILILTIELKALTWIDRFAKYKPRRLKLEPSERDIVVKQDYIWICSYQTLWNRTQQLQKLNFQTIILDQSESLCQKMLVNQQSNSTGLKKYLQTRHFIFPILHKLYLNRLQILIPLLSIIMSNINFQWFLRRYKKQNLTQLIYIFQNCYFTREISVMRTRRKRNFGDDNEQEKEEKEEKEEEEEKDGVISQFFCKLVVGMSEKGIQKIKAINKKSMQIQQKKILEDPLLARNRNQKLYIQSIFDALRNQKLQSILNQITHLCSNLHLKIAIIIQCSWMYRCLQNYLCQHQIPYCHYQQHQQILDFNTNPTKLVCLIKSQYLLSIDFNKKIHTKNQLLNQKLDMYQPQQYYCLSSTRHILFPDLDWVLHIDNKEQAFRSLFRAAGQIVRHYFVLKGSYEEKWMRGLEDKILKVQMHMQVKDDLLSEGSSQQNIVSGSQDPVFQFCQVNLAKVQEEYSHLKVIRGVTDIDEQFDRLQFEALQQKLAKQSKKKRKQQKARQKQLQYTLELQTQKLNEERKDITARQDETLKDQKITKSKMMDQDNVRDNIKDKTRKKSTQEMQGHLEIDSEQEYEIFLKKKTQKIPRCQQLQATIYQPSEQSSKKMQTTKISSQQKQPLPKPEAMKSIEIDPMSLEMVSQKYKNMQTSQLLDILKEGQTEEVEIIEIRKPVPKPKISKPRTQKMNVILRPSLSLS